MGVSGRLRSFLRRHRVVGVLEIDQPMARRAADLRAKHGIRTPDALQIAAALSRGATGFVTNDEAVKRVQEIEVLLLDEVIRSR